MVATALFLLSLARGPQGLGGGATGGAGDLSGLLAGSGNPPVMKISDLPATYKAFRIRTGTAESDGMNGLGSLMAMSMTLSRSNGNGNSAAAQTLGAYALNGIYFSEGKTIPFEGHSFLVTYRLTVAIASETLASSTPGLGSKLKLELVRTDDLRSVAPEPTITADYLKKTFTEAKVKIDEDVLADTSSSQRTASTAVTAAVMVPVLAQARLAAQKTAALSNAKQIGLGMLMYASDFDDVLPYANSTPQAAAAIRPYLKNDEIWKSPNPVGATFLYNCRLSKVPLNKLERPAETPMIYESAPWPDGSRVVAFADGHAKRLSKTEWLALQPMLNRRYLP